MSLKKYKRPDSGESDLTPKKIVGHSNIWYYLGLSDGFYDYYDRYEDTDDFSYFYHWDPEFEIPVYGEFIEKRAGRVQFSKRMLGAYIPEDAWLGKDGRRNKVIDSLFNDEISVKNTIGSITGFGK